jgi:hypothetical protein
VRDAEPRFGRRARAAACAAALGALATLPVGCGPPAGRARGPVAGALAHAPAPGEAAPEGDPVRAPAPLEPMHVDPAAIAALLASDRLPPLPLAGPLLAPGLTTVALLDTSRAEAAGMPADGGVRHVVLEEGQRAVLPVELRAGECMTIVVHAGLGVREVDAFVVAPSAPRGTVLAQEPVGGPIAIVGGRAGCFRPRASGPAEIAVVAREGSGPVLAAIFRAPPP